MQVDEVDRSGPGIGQHSEIVTNGEYRTEGAQRVAVWIVPARNIRLHADPWLQRCCGKTVARIGRNRPRPNATRTETAELPDRFIVEIPIRFFRRWRTPETCPEGVPGFPRRSAIVRERFSVQPQVIAIERYAVLPRT